MKIERKYFIIPIIFVVIAFICDNIFGGVSIPLRKILSSLFCTDNSSLAGGEREFVRNIICNFRLPKAITALLAGVGLPLCGLQMQTLFRNPLADPYILGVSASAGLGVALFIMGGSALGVSLSSTSFQTFGIAGAAMTGSILLLLLILAISEKLKDNLSMLIFGVMVSSIASALINLLQYASNESALKMYVLWTMGSFTGLKSSQLLILALLSAGGIILSVYNIKDLNGIMLGEQYANGAGINTKRVKVRIIVATTLLAGGITAFCGPIGFVGIAVPHIVRMIYKNADHKVLIPASAILGGGIMLVADTLSQLPGSGSIIPINTMAALMGIPVIFAIIIKNRA